MYYLQNHLGQWQMAIPAIAKTAIPFFKGIFGGGGPSEQERISAARSLASQQMANVRDLPSVIKKIEGYLQHNSLYWECTPFSGSESTAGRACIIAPCLVAKMLGWGDPLFIACNPLQKAPATFAEMENRLLPFFRKKLPGLKAELKKRQTPPKPAPSPLKPVVKPFPTVLVPTPTVPIPTPTVSPSIFITQPQPTVEPQLQEAGLGGPMLLAALGLGAFFLIQQK